MLIFKLGDKVLSVIPTQGPYARYPTVTGSSCYKIGAATVGDMDHHAVDHPGQSGTGLGSTVGDDS